MMELVRYGSLKPKKQKHYTHGEEKSFHNPPERHGLYAFNPKYVELFLLGGKKTHGKEKINRFEDHKRHNYKRFRVDGPIWVHIAYHSNCAKYVLARSGSWQLIHSRDYDKVFKKHAIAVKASSAKTARDHHFTDKPHTYLLEPAYRSVAKDETEIFVPKTTKIY